jgi:hypothetical protein
MRRVAVKIKDHSLLLSLLYNSLISTAWLTKYGLTTDIWHTLWRKCNVWFSSSIRTTIHGEKVLAPFGHPYPLITRQFRSFNNPLVELAYQCYGKAGRPITLIDIGAGSGDTILLLVANCPNMIG